MVEKCKTIKWDWKNLKDACDSIIGNLKLEEFDTEKTIIYGIARGGVVPAYIIAKNRELIISRFIESKMC